MCLSTVYRNTLTPDAVVMKNVMTIESKDGVIVLTDLMERQVAIEGTLEKANLVDGYLFENYGNTSNVNSIRAGDHHAVRCFPNVLFKDRAVVVRIKGCIGTLLFRGI